MLGGAAPSLAMAECSSHRRRDAVDLQLHRRRDPGVLPPTLDDDWPAPPVDWLAEAIGLYVVATLLALLAWLW